MKLTIYRGFTVEVSDDGDFNATKESYGTGWFPALALVKEKIDKIIKAESTKGFPIEAYKIIYSTFETIVIKGKITSYNPEDKSLWFSSDKGKREKIGTSYGAMVYPINEANNILVEQLKEKYALKKQTRKEIDTITRQLTQWEPTKEATDETK